MGDGSESPHHPAEFPAKFAAYAAQKMNPLHRQLIVENAAPGSIDGRLLLDDLAREFSNAESIEGLGCAVEMHWPCVSQCTAHAPELRCLVSRWQNGDISTKHDKSPRTQSHIRKVHD